GPWRAGGGGFRPHVQEGPRGAGSGVARRVQGRRRRNQPCGLDDARPVRIAAQTRPPTPARGTGMTCPICKKPSDPQYRPFCSRRCADIDLGRWLNGSYVIPVPETDEDETPPREEG